MIGAILLQFLPPVWEALGVRWVYHCDCLMNAEHVLLHHLIIPLLDLIQSSYHGIIIAFVAECPLHVHQQVLQRDVLVLVQHAGPFSWVPTETGKDVGVHTSLIILFEEGIYIEVPECVHHLHPPISRFKDRHIQSHRHQLLPLFSLCSFCAYASGSQSHSQWNIHQSLVPPYLRKRGANPLRLLERIGTSVAFRTVMQPLYGGRALPQSSSTSQRFFHPVQVHFPPAG